MFEYRARIVRWLDGDTCDVVIDLGFRIDHRLTIRLAGVDTPEANSPILEQRQLASNARTFAVVNCPPGGFVTIFTEKPDPRDKYGRWLGRIRCDGPGGPADLSDLLIRAGLGKPYDGGKR